jgi:hypothetical protein
MGDNPFSTERFPSLWERLHDAYVATCALEHCPAVSSPHPQPLCVPADAGRFLGRGLGVRESGPQASMVECGGGQRRP